MYQSREICTYPADENSAHHPKSTRVRRRSKVPPLAEADGFLGAWTGVLGPDWTPTLPRRRGLKSVGQSAHGLQIVGHSN